MQEKTRTVLPSFLRRLTNLSGNNRGLLLLRLSQEQFIDVHSLGFLNGMKSFELIRALVQNAPFSICPVHDSRMEAANAASQKLKMLQRLDTMVFEERGTNDLHVGWPFLRGKFSDGTLIRCPLLYFPVSLAQRGKNWVLEPRPDAGITFNKSFLLAYAFFQKLRVDEELLDFSFDEFDRDITTFLTQLYTLLDQRIELNFNRENFEEEIKPFVQYKRSDFEEEHHDGEMKLFPEAVLGMFPQTSSQLVPDYLHLLERGEFDDFDNYFRRTGDVGGIPGSHVPLAGDPPVREEKLYTPFSLDAFQEQAIQLVKRGNSLVVQGPPGTGKSQLICNLLADAMASGKKVLLVCQKRAALDVVYERMKSRDLSPFLGLVHDFRNDRRAIFDKIASQIERIEEYKSKNRSIDVIQTERRFVQVCRSIDHITEEIQEFKNALYREEECGLSVKQLYLTSDPSAPAVNMRQEYASFSFPIDDFLRRMKRIVQYSAVFEKPEYPWRERKTFAGLTPAGERVLADQLDDVVAFQRKVSGELFRHLGAEINLEDAENLWFRNEEVLGMLSILEDEEVYGYFSHMSGYSPEETSLLWLSNMERVTLNCFDEIGPEVTIPTEKLGKFQEALHERMKSRGSVMGKIRWEFFSDNKFVVKRALVANDLAYNRFGLRVLEQRIDTRLNLEHHLTALKSRAWLTGVPAEYRREDLAVWFSKYRLAIRARTVFDSLREVKGLVNPAMFSAHDFRALFRSVLDIIAAIPPRKEQWLIHLSAYQVRRLIHAPEACEELKSVLHRDFDSLCEYDQLREGLRPSEADVIRKLHDHTGEWKPAVFETLFENSLRLAWIENIELKYPVLRAVSSMKMEDLQRELQQLVAEKQKLSEEILLVRAREHAYEGLSYNRLNNLVTYRDLQHQVTKKKKLWPLRKLIATHSEELFRLLPCWMASPESVSAIFPMEPLFDLVIFDEASQCFAERGIPAVYRGKQVLVAGDRQQLKPSELYQIRWTDEGGENPDEEVESLLELAGRYLPTVHLQGHYRSKSVELMEFSNRTFYEGRLRLLPDFEVMNQPEPAIEYCKVDGVWENQQNEVEAREVVRQVISLTRDQPHREIGIVTFNAPQQNLILDILEEELKAAGLSRPSTLLVKNIENVQGDEKDVIIFSIGYAPDKRGKVNSQFGSLGVLGGENRLNVAVTRARERIVIVTSLWPEQLDAQESKNPGPRLLQQYLEYARQIHEKRTRAAMPVPVPGKGNSNLSARIRRWGEERLNQFTFEENSLPFADVHIRSAGRYLGVLLTDDERFRQSISIKDSFAYTPALLAQKRWKYRYVYSRQYWKDHPGLEQSLMYFIGGLQAAGDQNG